MPTNTDQQLLEQIRETLSREAGNRLSGIILYGSRATGAATQDSDFDILVVEKGPISRLEESKRLRLAMRDFPYPLALRGHPCQGRIALCAPAVG